MIIRGKRDPAIYRRLWLSRRMEREKASSSGMGGGIGCRKSSCEVRLLLKYIWNYTCTSFHNLIFSPMLSQSILLWPFWDDQPPVEPHQTE